MTAFGISQLFESPDENTASRDKVEKTTAPERTPRISVSGPALPEVATPAPKAPRALSAAENSTASKNQGKPPAPKKKNTPVLKEKSKKSRTESAPTKRRRKTIHHAQRPSPPYGIHLASYSNDIVAGKHMERLRRAGYTSKTGLHSVLDPFFTKDGKGFLRLIVGPYPNYSKALETVREFHRNGKYAAVVHFPERNRGEQRYAEQSGREAYADPFTQGSKTPTTAATPASHQKSGYTPDLKLIVNGDMIMDVVLDREVIYAAMLCAGREGRLFIPLSEITLALEFPISVFPDEGRAAGWFLSEDRKFSLDLGTMSAVSDKRLIQFEKGDTFIQDDDIYIRLERFNELFPLTLTPDYHSMQLVVDPKRPLPRQIRKRRNSERYISSSGRPPLKNPINDLDYALIAPPRLDAKVTAGYRESKDTKSGAVGSFAGNYRGDLLFFSSSAYIQGKYSPEDESSLPIENFTFLGERILHDNEYLRKVTFGDVTPTTLTDVPGGSRERGVMLTNRNPRRTTDYDVKTFTGTTIPGWEVELYRNGRLIDFTTVGDSGRYSFEDVPLYYGRNEFKLVIYGTEGQKEEREETVVVDSKSIRPGEMIYETSLTQEDTDVWNPKDSSSNDDTHKFRFRSKLSAGLAENVSATFGTASETYQGERKNTVTGGLIMGIGEFLAQLNTAVNDKEGRIASGLLRGEVLDHNLQFSHKQQLGKVQPDDQTLEKTSLNINGDTDITDDIPLSYGSYIKRQHNDSDDDSESLYYSLGTSLGITHGDLRVSNNISARLYEISTGSHQDELLGQFAASKYIDDIFLRGSASYEIGEETSFKNISATLSKPLGKETSGELGIERQMEDDEVTKYYGQINWASGPFTLFSRLQAEDNGQYTGMLGLSTGIDFSPFKGTPEIHKSSNVDVGGLSCRVFLDRDFNGEFSQGDKPLEGVEVRAVQMNRVSRSDAEGIAHFEELPPMYATDIELVESSLDDPRMISMAGSRAILPRKGRIYTMQIPVILSGEVDGSVYRAQSGELHARPGVPVELVDMDGKPVGRTRTDREGYFFFTGIAPGTYRLGIDEKYLARYGDTCVSRGKITIKRGGDSNYGQCLVTGPEKTLKKERETLLAKAESRPDTTLTADLIARIKAEQDGKTVRVAAKKTKPSPSTKGKGKQHRIKTKRAFNKVVLGVFADNTSVQRALLHYNDRYSRQLRGSRLDYLKTGRGYILYAAFKKPVRSYRSLAKALDLTSYSLRLTKGLNLAKNKKKRAMRRVSMFSNSTLTGRTE